MRTHKSNIVLTSTALSNLEVSNYIKVFFDNLSDKRVAIITNAADGLQENKYAKLAKEQLESLGFKKVFFHNVLVNDHNELKNSDVIYICGGNTFVLLNTLKSSKTDELIKKRVEDGALIIGVSAGSVILGRSIKIIGELEMDLNDIRLENLEALNILREDIVPHYDESMQAQIVQYEQTEKRSVIRIRNDEAYIFSSDGSLNKKIASSSKN